MIAVRQGKFSSVIILFMYIHMYIYVCSALVRVCAHVPFHSAASICLCIPCRTRGDAHVALLADSERLSPMTMTDVPPSCLYIYIHVSFFSPFLFFSFLFFSFLFFSFLFFSFLSLTVQCALLLQADRALLSFSLSLFFFFFSSSSSRSLLSSE